MAFGEIEGVLVAAGRYRSKPAVQIRTELYGFVWCVLTGKTIEQFGSEHRVSEVWEGRTVGVQGRLFYAKGSKLKQIEAAEVREIVAAPRINLADILDPEFTSGLDPNEYLKRLHEGH